MSRLQLALNVTDLNAAIEFYSKLFKRRPTRYALVTPTSRWRTRR